MQHNVGDVDRIARLVLGTVLVVVGLASVAGGVGPGPIVAVGLVLVGAVLAVTGWTGSCPIYGVLGVRTDGSRSSTGEEAPTEHTD